MSGSEHQQQSDGNDWQLPKYTMNSASRGWAVIINNKKFLEKTNLSERSGTDVDASALNCQFQNLGFDVRTYHNLSTSDMKAVLLEFSQMDHSNSDCFTCAILTYGEDRGVYGTDGVITMAELTESFQGHNCQSLAGKPKLFFIQACWDTKFDDEVELKTDVVDMITDFSKKGDFYRIPSGADFLMAFSAVPGYFAWRNSLCASWFIQSLCCVLSACGSTMEILKIMTLVNSLVFRNFESSLDQKDLNKKKQIPCFSSMLTKDLYFRPKNKNI